MLAECSLCDGWLRPIETMTSLVDFARPPWLSTDGDGTTGTEVGAKEIKSSERIARLSPLQCLVDPFILRSRVQQTVLRQAPHITRIDSEFYNVLQIGLREQMMRVFEEMSRFAKHRTQQMTENGVVTSDPDKMLRDRIRAEISAERQKDRLAREALEKERTEALRREEEEAFVKELEEMHREGEMLARGETYVPPKKKSQKKRKSSALPEAVEMAERADAFHRANAAACLAMQDIGPKPKPVAPPLSNSLLVAALAKIDAKLQVVEKALQKVAWTSQSAARLRNLNRLLEKQTMDFGNNDYQLACVREGKSSAGPGLTEQQQSEAQDLIYRLEAYRVLVKKRDEFRQMRREAEMRNPDRKAELLAEEEKKAQTTNSRGTTNLRLNSSASATNMSVESRLKRLLTLEDARACSESSIPSRVFQKHALRNLNKEPPKRSAEVTTTTKTDDAPSGKKRRRF